MIAGRVGQFAPADGELSGEEVRQRYGTLIDDALASFEQDPSYLVDMAMHANQIAYTRARWEVRTEVLRAEKAARQQCALDNRECPFVCTNAGACGFGSCRYAAPEHQHLETPSQSGNKTRPEGAQAATPKYNLQDTIAAILEERGVTPPPKVGRR